MNNQKDLIMENKLKIKIFGIGGAGNNVIDSFEIQDQNKENVYLYLANTDITHLNSKQNNLAKKISFGEAITNGNGTGANPDVARNAFKEDKDKFEQVIDDADIVFTVFGLGKGTGSGAGPEIARLAKEKNILSIAIAILPFSEMGGKRQSEIAETELLTINEKCDSYLLFSNDSILKQSQDSSDSEILNMEICKSIQAVIDIIFLPAIMNLDFADIKSSLTNKGLTVIGMGSGSGDNKANEAVRKAVESPFIEGSIQGANSILMHVVCHGKDNFKNLNQITHEIKTSVLSSDDINIVSGLTRNDNLTDEVIVRVIANDFENQSSPTKEKPISKPSPKTSKTSSKKIFGDGLLGDGLLSKETNLYSQTNEEEITPVELDNNDEKDLF